MLFSLGEFAIFGNFHLSENGMEMMELYRSDVGIDKIGNWPDKCDTDTLYNFLRNFFLSFSN